MLPRSEYKSLIQTISTYNDNNNDNDSSEEEKKERMPFILMAVRWRKPELERIFFQETSVRLRYQWKRQLSDDPHLQLANDNNNNDDEKEKE